MEDIIKALLDVVRAQHSAAENTEEEPFNMDDVVDMAMNIVGRPDESEELAEMVDSIQKMVESLAPDIFPPKTFEEMDDSERAVSAVNMIEERLKRGRTESSNPYAPHEAGNGEAESNANEEYETGEEEEAEETNENPFNPREAADLNDLIYKNLMEMMGLQNPQVEFPFDQSQLQYGREKSMTELLEEEAQADAENTRSLSAWELAQNAIDRDESEHQKEPYIPQVAEERETKSASQLAAEAIRRSQEEEKEKLEIEKRAERLMEEAKKRGQDPMKFALHQQEILQYMEKNSDELVSFEDYEDLSPEEKLEIERQIHIEKQIADGVNPDEIDDAVPEEFIPQELKVNRDETADDGLSPDTQRTNIPPVMTEEMLRQLSQEVIRENSDMILSENENEDMDNLNEAIFENIRRMMSGSGTEVEKEDVGELLEQAAESEKQKALSAVELAKAAQQAAKPEPKEIKEGKSAVELAKEAQEQAKKMKAATEQAQQTETEQTEKEPEEETAAKTEPEQSEPEDMEQPEETNGTKEAKEAEKTAVKMEPEDLEPAEQEEEETKSAEAVTEKTDTTAEEMAVEKAAEEQTDLSLKEEFIYVDPDELVLGEHTQAEIDEAIENLNSLGLEGDVYNRAKRMLLLELADSEAELDAWLKEQEEGKKKKAAVSILDEAGDLSLDDLDDIDEDDLEKELEMAMDEDFLEEEEEEEDETGAPEGGEAESEDTEAESELTREGKETDAVEIQEEKGEVVSEIEVEDTVSSIEKKNAASRKITKASSARKKVVKKKERDVSGAKVSRTTTETVSAKPAEEKSYQVSVHHPFVLKNSASFMNQFEEYIMDTQENRKLSTGFRKLDAMLRYGLHKGSYFVDAEPQYLKNSFMQQMADRAAESGVDVLYISTELSRYDLMVDTISRISYEINQGDLNKAVSAMDIMTGENGADIASLEDELNWYRGRISEHLYILDQEAVTDYTDSMDEVSAGDILAELIRSIVREGAHKPVVFIDNIENILSVEDSEDMKPLMDGIRQLAKELGIPIILSYGYAQAENETELNPAEKEFRESLGNMCDVYMELQYADMITEDSVELTEDDIRDMVEDGDTLLINVMLHKNRRAMRASCQIEGIPKFNYFEE